MSEDHAVPLPFLTADRAPADPAADTHIPLPHLDRARWRRPYRPGPYRVAGSALLMLLGACLLISGILILLTGTAMEAAVPAGLALLCLLWAVRLLRAGIWVSSRGLRRAGLLTTTTLPWSATASVRTVQQPVRWLGLPRTVQGQALAVHPVEGEPLRPLLTDHNADFLGHRKAFDRAADVIEGWAAESRLSPASRTSPAAPARAA